jgi:hypothetical protein
MPTAQWNADALLGCAMLLYCRAWASLEENKSSIASAIDFGLGSLIVLANGPKNIFTETFYSKTTVWDMVALHSPKVSINKCAKQTKFPAELEQTFKDHFSNLKPRDGNVHRFDAYMQECRRLIPVISVLKLSKCGGDVLPYLSDSIRYLFTFPGFFGEQFLQLVEQEDECVQIVLTYYYATISLLASDTYWWSQKRTRIMLERMDCKFVEEAFVNLNKIPDTVRIRHNHVPKNRMLMLLEHLNV